jgi:hypothetical protein
VPLNLIEDFTLLVQRNQDFADHQEASADFVAMVSKRKIKFGLSGQHMQSQEWYTFS